MTKEKQFTKWITIRFGILLAVYLVVRIALGVVLDNTLLEPCMNMTSALRYDDTAQMPALDKLEITMDRTDLIQVTSLEQIGDAVYWTIKPIANEAGDTFVSVTDPTTGQVLESTLFRVSSHGLVLDANTDNFSHYRERQLCMVLLFIAMSVLLWAGYRRSIRMLRYSYQSIFCAGLGLWMSVYSVLMVVQYVQNIAMINLYSSLCGTAGVFATYTFPMILLFAVLLSISNVSLIRHEGFRFANALGLMLSVAMVAGFFFLLFFSELINSGSDMELKVWDTISSLFEIAYALLECFLIGSIVCGKRAAKHQPAFDKDYIVILGCKVRKDGSLYPLIRGRVDRAIRFYNEQLQATGKRAIFIPSGGRGPDEPLSEGEAMGQYLLQQGIPREQVLPETKSINTRQNMQFSMQLMEAGKTAVFATTNYHVFRSGIIAGLVGFDAEGIGSSTKWYFWPNAYVREVVGMLSYKWKSLVLFFIPIVAFLAVVRFVLL